jgi:disulfide bond formation protein DsbB
MSRISARAWFLLGFLCCTGLILIALYLQYFQHLDPCPLCMMQRVAFIALGLIFLIGAIHGPRRAGAKIYAFFGLLASISGLALAARHTWLQFYPPAEVSCAGDVYSQLERLPLGRFISNALRATGDCSKVDWTMLGLSVAEWSLVWFVILTVLGLYLLFRRGPGR